MRPNPAVPCVGEFTEAEVAAVVVMQLPIAAFVCNMNSQIIATNGRSTFLGHDPDDLTGAPITDLIPTGTSVGELAASGAVVGCFAGDDFVLALTGRAESAGWRPCASRCVSTCAVNQRGGVVHC